MKLNNCKSQNFLSSKKHQSSPQDSMVEDSPEICQLLQKLTNLQQKQQRTKTMYMNKINQLKTILSQQSLVTVNLQEYIKELRRQNQKQLNYLQQMKREIMKQLSINTADTSTSLDIAKPYDGLLRQTQPKGDKEKSQQKRDLRLLRSLNLRQSEKKSVSRSSSRSKLSLFKSTSTLFGKNSQTLLKKSLSTKDLIKIQSEYFEQSYKKF